MLTFACDDVMMMVMMFVIFFTNSPTSLDLERVLQELLLGSKGSLHVLSLLAVHFAGPAGANPWPERVVRLENLRCLEVEVALWGEVKCLVSGGRAAVDGVGTRAHACVAILICVGGRARGLVEGVGGLINMLQRLFPIGVPVGIPMGGREGAGGGPFVGVVEGS
jgi:hypothetical protein